MSHDGHDGAPDALRHAAPVLGVWLWPVLALAAAALVDALAATGSGLMPGRGAALVLPLAALLPLLRRPTAVPAAVLWLAAALAWQALTLAWAPITAPGELWLGLRGAALATAVGIAVALADAATWQRAAVAAGWCGAGILVLGEVGDLVFGGITLGERAGLGAAPPFGLGNFDVAAGLPLLFAGLAAGRAGLPPLILGGCAALALALRPGEPVRAVWLAGGAAALVPALLRLPTRWQVPLVSLGAALLLALTAVAAWRADLLPAGSTQQRGFLWQAAAQAVAGPEALIGSGVGAALAVLPEQSSFAAAWLAVPSFAEHVHHEPLQALLDGGVPLLALLALALAATLRPLWAARATPVAAALLAAWAAVLAQALVDPALTQPGPLLGLALLAGLTWAAPGAPVPVRALPVRPLPARAPAAVALVLALFAGVNAGREFLGAAGLEPTAIERRARQAADAAVARRDWPAARAALDRLAVRLGPLDGLDAQRADLAARAGSSADAATLLAAHLDRFPADGLGLDRARQMLAGRDAPALRAAYARALARARALRPQVRPWAKNAAALADLDAALRAAPP